MESNFLFRAFILAHIFNVMISFKIQVLFFFKSFFFFKECKSEKTWDFANKKRMRAMRKGNDFFYEISMCQLHKIWILIMNEIYLYNITP